MKITRRVKEINARIPDECPFCAAKPGSPTLCDMCLGLRSLRAELGLDTPRAYTGRYDKNGRWKKDHDPQGV